MKKLISIAILFVMVMTVATTMVSAVTSATLVDELYAIASKYGISKARIERNVKAFSLDDTQAEQILAEAKKADAIMTEAGVTDPTKLTQEDRNKLAEIADTVTSLIPGSGWTVKNGNIVITKNGEVVDEVPLNSDAPYTGSNVSTVLVVSSVAILALATVFVVRRKIANA